MTIEEGIALAVVAAAAAWLGLRWRRRGLDDHEATSGGCSACPHEPPAPLARSERPDETIRSPPRP